MRLLAITLWAVTAGLLWLVTASAMAAEGDGVPSAAWSVRLTFTDSDKNSRTVEGRIVVEAQDGGILLLGLDGMLWSVTPKRLVKREATGKEFEPLSADELGRQLQREFGDGFEIVQTRHYVICTNAGRAYGRWCGALFERLMSSFRTHWRSRALDLHDPKLPLAAVVFADAQQFARFATKDAGQAAAEAKGYYSVRTNRMVLYDLTAAPGSRPATTPAEVNRKIAASPFNAATIVHEATHQIAFNCGMHARYADTPLWLSEGMAMYFETPDLESRVGWRTVGQVNRLRLAHFQDYARNRRKPDSLLTLISDNDRFTSAGEPDSESPARPDDAYAEAWALSYFLIKTRRKQYLEYLNRMAQKPPLIWDEPEQRLKEFRAAFGEDLKEVDRQFLRYVARLRGHRP